MSEISRQTFLKLLAAGGASFFGLPASRYLLGAEDSVRGPVSPWARLKYTCVGGDDDDWNVHPNADLNLIDSIRELSSANVAKKWNVAEVTKLETMTAFPFLFMHSDAAPELDDAERANIREYLLRGGFLFAEDCVNGKYHSDRSGDMFFRRMIQVELPKILPEARVERLPFDHPVFHCFNHFDRGLPHMQGVPHGLHGVTLNGRVVALLSPSDLHCGWANGENWFGRGKQIQAFQMGTNIYLYAMTQAGGLSLNDGALPTSGPDSKKPLPT